MITAQHGAAERVRNAFAAYERLGAVPHMGRAPRIGEARHAALAASVRHTAPRSA